VRFVDEYRGEEEARKLVRLIEATCRQRWTLMEICGGQTHTILKFGIDQLIPERIELIHGPGCPVCVTPVEMIDRAIAIARRPGVIFTSFGDMLRVPGTGADLFSVKAGGGDVRMVYSPLDAVRLALTNPNREVVFFAVGFETTAPANAMAVLQAREQGLANFTILSSHVLVPPAMEAILQAPSRRIQGFPAAGHVCTVMGYREYEPIADRHRIPVVVTGFEPLDLLQGIQMAVLALEEGRFGVLNQYARVVTREGNARAQESVHRVFEVVDRKWRGIGLIPGSGLSLRAELGQFDAEKRFAVEDVRAAEASVCIAGEILQGLKKPLACPAFGAQCTPERPLGAPMVSSEGACAAYFQYGRTH
jgi:hydrogenase expression/formation protein HypD